MPTAVNTGCQQRRTHGYPLWLPLIYFPAQIITKHTAKTPNTQFNCYAHVLIAYWCLFILWKRTVRKSPISYLWLHTTVLNHPQSVRWQFTAHLLENSLLLFSQESLASDQRIRCYIYESPMDLLKALRTELTSTDMGFHIYSSWLKILKGTHFLCI